MYKVTVELLLDVEDEAEACDAMNEILREQQRTYIATSCFLDYQLACEPVVTDGGEFAEYMETKGK